MNTVFESDSIVKESILISDFRIANWEFLADIVRTQVCEQEMTIGKFLRKLIALNHFCLDWQPLSVDGSSQGFAIESVLEQRREFVANYTKGNHFK